MMHCRCTQRSDFHLVCDCSEWEHGIAAGMYVDEIAFALSGLLSDHGVTVAEAAASLAYARRLLDRAAGHLESERQGHGTYTSTYTGRLSIR